LSEYEVDREDDDDDGVEDAQSGYDQRGSQSGGFVVFETLGCRRRGSGEEDEEKE
jgi:hypothetical protein